MLLFIDYSMIWEFIMFMIDRTMMMIVIMMIIFIVRVMIVILSMIIIMIVMRMVTLIMVMTYDISTTSGDSETAVKWWLLIW